MIYHLNLSFSLSLLLTGFLLANIFGIITNSKNIIFLLVLGIELINFFIYSCKPSLGKKTSTPVLTQEYTMPKKLSRKSPFFSPFYLVRFLNASQYVRRSSKMSYATEGSLKKQKSYQLLFFDFLLDFFKLKGLLAYNIKNMDRKMRYKSSRVVSTIASILNFLKIGFEFGFFVDAFKLGS